MINGPCRLFSGSSRRVDVQVAGAGPVPGKGVVGRRAQRRHAASELERKSHRWSGRRIGFLGDAGVADQNKISSSLMVLPVGADGKVSFFTSFGATDLAVSVVGYYVDPERPGIPAPEDCC